ncbi:hypothetical protein BGZ49_005341 [Haplosporangium sp. Z 27]|nr:hypothetical protein BGZ49_005341 [Haplosporangium sp. Z 27]
MLKWIENEVQESEPEFAKFFQKILLVEKGIMNRSFKLTSGSPLSIQSVFHLRGEEYVDDDIIRAMLEIFSEAYGAKGWYLFIPPLKLNTWRNSTKYSKNDWDWNLEHLQGTALKEAFAVVLMPGHWGALCVDFQDRKLSFGDSLSRMLPVDAKSAIFKWIGKEPSRSVSQWSKATERFRVAQQPHTSGSCGINALNAIEHRLNPEVEFWTHKRSAFHRTRALKLVTGYSKLKALEVDDIRDGDKFSIDYRVNVDGKGSIDNKGSVDGKNSVNDNGSDYNKGSDYDDGSDYNKGSDYDDGSDYNKGSNYDDGSSDDNGSDDEKTRDHRSSCDHDLSDKIANDIKMLSMILEHGGKIDGQLISDEMVGKSDGKPMSEGDRADDQGSSSVRAQL